MPDSSRDQDNLREVLNAELSKYSNKFMLAMIIQIPIFMLMWVVPYLSPALMTAPVTLGCKPVYIVMLLMLSSFNQFFLGASFYRGAFKSVMNRSANMDALVVLGTSAAWLYGLILLVIGYQMPERFESYSELEREELKRNMVHEHAHNFEVSSTLITVILFGKCLEAYSKK